MEIKNKKTGYIFEINEKEGIKLIINNQEEFEPLDKKFLHKKTRAKTIKDKVMGTNCLKALNKKQIIQELKELSIDFDIKAKKEELIEILKEVGGY